MRRLLFPFNDALNWEEEAAIEPAPGGAWTWEGSSLFQPAALMAINGIDFGLKKYLLNLYHVLQSLFRFLKYHQDVTHAWNILIACK